MNLRNELDTDIVTHKHLVLVSLARQYKDLNVFIDDCQCLGLSRLQDMAQQLRCEIDRVYEHIQDSDELSQPAKATVGTR